MVQQKKPPNSGNAANGAVRREQNNMSFQRRDITDARAVPGGSGRPDSKTPNGNRSSSFRTDTAISNNRAGNERVLVQWKPDSTDDVDGSLEQPASSNGGKWDQFAENERLFGLKSDYDENIYTTSINKNDPRYAQRLAAAEKKAREIERSTATTSHVAEERVMDFAGGDYDGDEEDKYSGVRRGEFPPLGGRDNKYTPPARRAPSGASTVPGAPVDPAIISSQLKDTPAPQAAPAVSTTPVAPTAPAAPRKQLTPKAEEFKVALPAVSAKPQSSGNAEAKVAVPKAEAKPSEPSSNASKTPDVKSTDSKTADKAATPLRPAASASRTVTPQTKESAAAPSATATVEHDVLKEFKSFATQQRANAEKARTSKAKADKEIKLQELKKFADSFKLSTPVPSDLISIIAKDPAKQQQIQAKALLNVQEKAKAKTTEVTPPKDKESQVKETPTKPANDAASTPTPATAPADSRANARPAAPQNTNTVGGAPNRHPNARQSYAPQQHYQQNYRNSRAPPHMTQPSQPTGNLSARLRNNEQQKMHQGPHPHLNQQHMPVPDMRLPPTGPANSNDQGYNRRLSGVPSAQIPAKLNPTSHEFRPSGPYPSTFGSAAPSQGSSPRFAAETQPNSAPAAGQLIRRKTKAVDVKKCFILTHIKAYSVTQNNLKLEENDGLRPSYDTPPTWRQLLEETEKPDSTMHLTYKEYFEKLPISGANVATPNPTHVIPQLAHQHQLPFHLQHGAHVGPRQSPHMAPMQMQAGQPGHAPHVSFNGTPDDHRMMHSNSAQSYASPRLGQLAMAYPPSMSSPAQPPYQQPVMQPYMNPGAPQMAAQYRSFSNNPQFLPQQPPHMGNGPMMMQPGYIGANPMMPGGQPVMYPPGTQFIQQAGGPPGSMPGTNGFPSPGRPQAPMMVQQGSHQGYGMSPAMHFQQPVYPGQQGKFPGPRPQ